MDKIPNIFVSIASYRDSELIPTLVDMVAQSANPASLHISICWQCDEDISIFLNQGMELTQQRDHNGYTLYVFSYQLAMIQVISVQYYLSKGACWARHIAEGLYNNEEYFLQIDSHCRFIECWDSQLIGSLGELTFRSPRPVLTGYPPPYQPDKLDEKSADLIRIIFGGFSPDKILQLRPHIMDPDTSSPVEGSYLAGGFIFSFGSFVTDVPNDPQVFFEGEEIAMAARAFTHGYDLYYPDKVFLWHFYGREKHVKVWSDHNEEAKSKGDVEQGWWERDALSKKRVKTLLGQEVNPQCEPGIYRLGELRSLSQFEKRAGVDFRRCLVHPDVISAERKCYFSDAELTENEWRSKLVNVNKKTIQFDTDRVNTLRKDTMYWYVAVYSQSNILIEQKTLYQNEVLEKLTASEDGCFSLPLDFSSEEKLPPHVVRISSFHATLGWGENIEELW